MRKLLYVGEDIGCKNTAMYLHAQNVAELFSAIGYQVKIICTYAEHQNDTIESNIEYVYAKSSKTKFGSRCEEVFGNNLWKEFITTVRREKPDTVLFYGYSIEKKIINYCKRNHIKIYIERVDWFSKEDRSGFYARQIYQKKVDYSIRQLDKMADGVIAISQYLYSFYKDNKVNVYWLPPVFKSINDEIVRLQTKNINIIYAGSLNGKKDIIRPFLTAVHEYNRLHGLRFICHVIGKIPDEEAAQLNKYKGVNLYGEMSHEEVKKLMQYAHFGILLRNNRKYAKAGFSTKFAEMMSCGISMICTNVGGADKLIEDGVNGFLLEENSQEEILKLLDRLSCLSDSELNSIRSKALMTAKKYFLINNYIDSLRSFLRGNN